MERPENLSLKPRLGFFLPSVGETGRINVGETFMYYISVMAFRYC